MLLRQNKILLAIFLTTMGVSAAVSPDSWKRFNSSRGFSLRYPGSWSRIGASMDRLQLLSSQGGAKGIIIKRGQAEITAMEAEASPTETLARVIEYYTQGTVILSRRDIAEEAIAHGCSELKEVISKESSVPATDVPTDVSYIINTDFFCLSGNHKVVVLLRNWEGDKRQGEYQHIALGMAKSIELLP